MKGVSFYKNCGAASVGVLQGNLVLSTEFSNVNWPTCEEFLLSVGIRVLETLYGGQFTLSSQLVKPN